MANPAKAAAGTQNSQILESRAAIIKISAIKLGEGGAPMLPIHSTNHIRLNNGAKERPPFTRAKLREPLRK